MKIFCDVTSKVVRPYVRDNLCKKKQNTKLKRKQKRYHWADVAAQEKVNGNLYLANIIVPLYTNDCFGLQGLEANEIETVCYCRFS